MASPRKKPSISLHAPTISTVSSSSLLAFSAESSGSLIISSTKASVEVPPSPEPPDEEFAFYTILIKSSYFTLPAAVLIIICLN
jgi:hypothetical protein